MRRNNKIAHQTQCPGAAVCTPLGACRDDPTETGAEAATLAAGSEFGRNSPGDDINTGGCPLLPVVDGSIKAGPELDACNGRGGGVCDRGGRGNTGEAGKPLLIRS